MDIDEFEIEKINFCSVAKGLGFHKSVKKLPPLKRQKTRRSRWRIENENFKTLKEETSYNLEHSYGHGKKYLCTVFAYLTYLSFLIDQTQELVCDKFNKAPPLGPDIKEKQSWIWIKNEVKYRNKQM